MPAGFERLHPQEQFPITKRETAKINANLKRALAHLGISKKLSSHVAWRTLATLGARALSGDLQATSGLLGHRRTSTTEICLKAMGTFEVDAAARTVYDALRAGKTQVKQASNTQLPSVSDWSENAA